MTPDKQPRASTTRDSDKYIVRFPEGMREQIAAAAKASGRSMNAEIVARLGAKANPVPTSLIDFFGAKAMQAILTGATGIGTLPADVRRKALGEVAQLSYEIADAMMEARSSWL